MRIPPPGSATTIFLVFFGVALLDAVSGGRTLSVLFWLAVGVVFGYADLRHVRRLRSHG